MTAASAKFGIGTWSYTVEGAAPFLTVARQLADEGYDGVELDGGRDFFHPQTLSGSADRRRLIADLRAIGLDASAFNPAFYEFDLATGDHDERRRYLEAVRDALELCVDCGIGVMRLDTGQSPPGPAGLGRAARLERVIAVWEEATTLASRAGVRLAWEFEPGFMCNTPSEVIAVVDAIDDPHFGVLFDSCHAHMVAAVGARQEPPEETLHGGELELAHRLAGRVNWVHLIDSDETIHDDFTSTHAPFGLGVVDFPPLVQALREGGYAGPWWSVDLCFWPEPSRWSKPSLDAIRGLVAEA